MAQNLSEQELVRRENMQKLIDLGINPYPGASVSLNATAQEIRSNFAEGESTYQDVCLAGRLMSRRIMGKASFAELMDSSGRIQLYVSRDDICPGENKDMYNTVFKKLLDLGDFIMVKGFTFFTQKNELTIHVKEIQLLSKSLKPLPIVKIDADGEAHDAVTDPELRYRQRYVDLVVNPEVRETFKQRTKMYNTIREFLNEKEYLEVETPILQPIYGGAAARPFTTWRIRVL